MSLLVGRSLGRYHLLEQLGEGGMATVYKAFDTRVEREVAVKVIRVDQFAPAHLERVLKRFEREARALARLSHPNIVGVIEYGEHDNAPFLVMHYVSGGTLKGRLGKPVPWDDAIRLVLPIAYALDYAHRQGIIHRDVKPSNILLTEVGQPMLTDFGIAKVLESGDGQTLSTTTGVGVGTPEYMAPEQGLGQEVDSRADIYSLGIVLYELITGRKPFRADTPMAVIVKQVNDPLPRLRQFAPNVPDAVERRLFKALAKKPEARYRSMSEFGKAMDGLLAPLRAKELAIAQKQAEHARKKEAQRAADAAKHQRQQVRSLERTRSKEKAHAERRAVIDQAAGVARTTLAAVLSRRRSGIFMSIPWILGAALVLLIGGGFFLTGNQSGLFTINWSGQAGSGPTAALLPVAEQPSTPSYTPSPAPSPTNSPTPEPAFDVGSTWVRPADVMTMVFVPEGEFTMGSTDGPDDQQPAHRVFLDAYWIDRTEVTNSKYAICVANGACTNPGTSIRSSEHAEHPVVAVNWEDARIYCAWAGARLPTEAEWEKAARGSDGRIFPWGSLLDNDKFEYSSPDAPAGRYPAGASPYGALDMAGSVLEWVNDWYSPSYYQVSPLLNPQGPASGNRHVLRGGWLFGSNRNVRSDFRDGANTDFHYYWLSGFRCARSE